MINPPTAIISTIISYLSLVNLLVVITPIITGPGRELLNLAKIYINEKKYSSHNNSFTFKLVIFHNIYSRVNT